MPSATLEHVNFTVSDPKRTAERLCRLFGWKIRWQGPAKDGGFTVHVGADDNYLAIYTKGDAKPFAETNYDTVGGLNHVGIVVDDLDAAEQLVQAEGFKTHSHADYEPGRRFYFHDDDGIEFEVVSYRN